MTTSASRTHLPETFDLNDIHAYLRTTGLSAKNTKKTMRVLSALINGHGITYRHRSDTFMNGHAVTPYDDLGALRDAANAWLPYLRGSQNVDRTHGWTINHPILRLIDYKRDRLGVATTLVRCRRRRRRGVSDPRPPAPVSVTPSPPTHPPSEPHPSTQRPLQNEYSSRDDDTQSRTMNLSALHAEIARLRGVLSRQNRPRMQEHRRKRIAAAQQWTCALCTVVLSATFHVDHIVRWADSFDDSDSNLQALCVECHTTKTSEENAMTTCNFFHR